MTDQYPLTDAALDSWLKRNPDLARQMNTDAGDRLQLTTMRSALSAVERAMATEGIAQDVRRRVINAAVFDDSVEEAL
jgi:hypothetical protein